MRVAFLGNFQVSYTSETHHAASLESLGHTVERLQEPKATAGEICGAASEADLMVWVHTHGWDTPGINEALAAVKRVGTPIVAYHLDLYMGLRRWRDYQNSPYMSLVDHFFTVDKRMAGWLDANTDTRGHYLQAGVFGPECYLSDQPSDDGNDVVFVGSRGYHPEWPYRPILLEWLKSSYGQRFTHVGGDGQVRTTRGDALNRLYAGSTVVVGDSLCPLFDYPHYWSDRVYETLGRVMLDRYFPDDHRTFIEDQVYGRLVDAHRIDGDMGWLGWRTWIYTPEGNIQRSYHTDGRAGEPKYG